MHHVPEQHGEVQREAVEHATPKLRLFAMSSPGRQVQPQGPSASERHTPIVDAPQPKPAGHPSMRESYLKRRERAPGEAVDVKLADRLSNVQRLDTHPSPDKQRSYYPETVENILTLSRRRPWFAMQFSAWRHVFSHLEARQQQES
jgi:hypothetical protein